jgi:hypothetical protein
MYKQKSEIIKQIQSYHKQVAKLYYGLYEKIEDKEMKLLVYNLYEHENFRDKYLEKHKKVAEAIKGGLDFPCNKLSNQISDCFKNINTESDLNMEELIKLELYFDDCLIKLYNILASENELSDTVANIFYYMLKKTKKEKTMLTNMFYNSKNNVHNIAHHELFSL